LSVAYVTPLPLLTGELVVLEKHRGQSSVHLEEGSPSTMLAMHNLDGVYTFVYHGSSDVMAELSFEWDEEKNAANIKNHGIDFLDAALIFENPTIEAIDDQTDYGELRCVALGLSGEIVLHVVYTWRGENAIRIISARKANRHDAERYYREIFA
jgi:uncharacterized protein